VSHILGNKGFIPACIRLRNCLPYFNSVKRQIKIKIVPVQALKVYRRRTARGRFILNLGARRRLVANTTPWPHSSEKEPWCPLNRGWVGPRDDMKDVEKRNV
jgi:hypothetical protein